MKNKQKPESKTVTKLYFKDRNLLYANIGEILKHLYPDDVNNGGILPITFIGKCQCGNGEEYNYKDLKIFVCKECTEKEKSL